MDSKKYSCRACSATVARGARACPGCGAADPWLTGGQDRALRVVMFVAVMAAAISAAVYIWF